MKILTNIITHQDGRILDPWLINFKIFQSHGAEVFVNTGLFVKKLGLIRIVSDFEWLDDDEKMSLAKNKTKTKFDFIWLSIKRNYLAIRNVKKNFEENNFDFIYTPSSVLDFTVFPFYLKMIGRKIKWATTLANIVPLIDEGNKLIRFLAWFFFQISVQMIKKADVIFASTPEIRNYLLERGFDDKKVMKTGFAVENEMIARAEWKKEFNFDALFVGRINETKGIYDMLEVLDLVRMKYSNFVLAIMGGGDKKTKEEFKNKIREMKLEKNVQFLGYRTGKEKYDIIKSAKSFWFLSKSQSESFGVALLEAVCSGVPSFSYDLPQFRWLYPDGEVDISSLGDYRLVAQKVIRLFKSDCFENEKGRKLLGKYSWEKIAEQEYVEIKKMLK